MTCLGRRWTAEQNLTPLALSSAEKSVTVGLQRHTHTNKQTNKQTVNYPHFVYRHVWIISYARYLVTSVSEDSVSRLQQQHVRHNSVSCHPSLSLNEENKLSEDGISVEPTLMVMTMRRIMRLLLDLRFVHTACFALRCHSEPRDAVAETQRIRC